MIGRRQPTDPAERVPRKDRMGASPLTVGLLTLFVFAVAIYFGFAKDIPFTHDFRVKAVFESSNSIRKNSPVRIAGVEVGKVKEAASNLKDRVMGSDDDDYSGSAVGTVGDKASSAKDTVGEKASDAREAVRQAPRRMKRRAQGNPLAAGVIATGLALCAAHEAPHAVPAVAVIIACSASRPTGLCSRSTSRKSAPAR